MSTLSFVQPALLWGLLLASIPLIIHLLFRRRFRRIDWAPMHYLKLSIQRNRRRIRLEQLLLLLARTAIILLLFFMVARPLMHASGLGSWLSGRSRTSQLLVLDDSLSMDYRDQGRSAFDRALELAVNLVRSVGPKDRFTLVLTSQPKTPLLRDVEIADPDQTVQLLKSLKPGETFTHWEPTIRAVDELLASGTYPISEVTIISDLRRAGWEEKLAEFGDRWAGNRVQLRLFDVGCESTQNHALASFEQVDRLALAGAPVHWEAVVRNGTSVEANSLDANWIVDGKPTLVRVPAIAAGDSARLPLQATFQDAGLHHVSLSLPADDLSGDNQRWAVVNVRESLNMLLVDGEPSSEPLAGEVDFLGLALSLGIGEADAPHVEVVTDAQWSTMADARPDLLVLANVASVTAAQADRLARLVESGTGLMIFVGEQVDPDNYNQVLFKNGAGVLPAALESIADEELSGLVVDTSGESALDALGQLNAAVLERIAIRKYFQLRLPPEDAPGVRVLARWNNAASSPAVVEKVVGRGRVLLWTITADKNWSDWPTEPSYVLAMREAARAIARTDANTRTLTAGEAIRRAVPADHEIKLAQIEQPQAEAPQPLAVAAPDAAADRAAGEQTLIAADTRRAGLYKLTWSDSVAGGQSDLFAVNPDERESDLARLTPEAWRGLWGRLNPEVISAASDVPLATRGQEIWRSLALGLLGLVAFEACFATWAGRQR